MEQSYPKSNYFVLLLSILLFFSVFYLERRISLHVSDHEILTSKAQAALLKEENSVTVFMDSLGALTVSSESLIWDQISSWTDEMKNLPSGLSFFVFKRNHLLYWSDNNILIDPQSAAGFKNQQFVFLNNGWYEYFIKTWGPYTVHALLLIKYEYPFKNKYITNLFNPVLKLPVHTILLKEKSEDSLPIFNNMGEYLFSVKYTEENDNADFELPLMLLFFTALATFLLFLYTSLKYLAVRNPILAYGILFGVVGLRWLGLYYKIPTTFFSLPIFSPQFYASSYLLNSLGDFLISALVFTFLVVFFHNYFNFSGNRKKMPDNKLWISYMVVFVFLFTFLFSVFVNYLLSGLILDSKISFNINNIFELSGYSLLGFAIIGMLLFSFYLICDGSIRFIQRTSFTSGQISILFLITQGLFLILLLWLRDTELFQDYGVTSFLLANSLIIFISYIRSTARQLFSFTRTLLVILGFSIYAAKTIADFNDVKELEGRKLLALKLENEHDLIAEYLFDEVSEKIAHDRFIGAYLKAASAYGLPIAMNKELLDKRIIQFYLNGYWGKFDIKLKYFNRDGLLLGNDPGDGSLNSYDPIIESHGIPTSSNGLYYISNTAGRASYLGRIHVKELEDTSYTGSIIITLDARFVEDEGGFPELLLSDRIPERKDYSNYSYAKYEYNQLVSQYGKYPYFNRSNAYEKLYPLKGNERLVNFNGYSHLLYRYGSGGLIVISRLNQNIVVFITLFSYIFTFFCLLFVSAYILYKLIKNSFRLEINFKTRIQFMVFAIVMATILLTGGGTIYYIIGNYAANQNQKVSEKLSSLVVLLQNELDHNQLIPGKINEETQFSFSRLSSNLALDFNIYNTNGLLAFSTQPRIFEQNILSRAMNAYAFKELHIKQRTQLIHYEQMGSMNFLSAYEPIRNSRNEITGYINLPYFAKQNVLKKEISSLLVTLINIYVFLFSLAMFATYIISNRITRPLGIIQTRLSQIKLGKRNEPLEWAKKDEIGALVNEYNSMVEELHDSAELLAKSERESAWREMAKQVAHEIKNPLTPMKLSVQHLQRAWKEKSPNLESIMQRFSQTLIEQIDTLSNIANEFSNFAKMPKAANTPLDLSVILQNIVNLYAESERIRIQYEVEKYPHIMVFADKDQLLRAFSNLMKNAVQAIPDNCDGFIKVLIRKENSNYLITISDNGSGIPDDKVNKIFTPNFTTKTAGTGLGLAMVKNTIENAGGSIWFETMPGQGTTFFISLPVYEEPAA